MRKYHTVIGIIFVSVLGTLAHFLYELSSFSTLVGLFTPVNESIWEHLKLLFFPVLLFSVIEYFVRNKKKCFVCSRTIALFIGMLFIVVAFYTISGVIGKAYDWVNIAIYYVSVLIVFLGSELLIKNCKGISHFSTVLCLSLLILTAALFFIFTFYTPSLNIFIDPVTKFRGIYRK